ncbi:MAG: glycosyltransferase family 4 protein [Thermoanaerobaculia bacterium]|nr:glycosyltransferase family 4 protein [Thermoanaerobaculia bacterium]
MTERRKRVLLDARKARDFGIGTYIRGLLRGLAGLDRYELHALVLPGEEGLLPPGVSARTCAAPHYSLGELVAVRRSISALKPDAFHAPHYVVPFFPPQATVVTIHDLMHLTRPEHATPAKRVYARWMIGRALRLSARVIAVSESTKKEILAFGPEWGGKVVVIPNGVREDFLERGRERATALTLPVPAAAPSPSSPFKESSSSSSSYLLFLGNDKPHKNLDGLLRAWPGVRAVHPALSLVLAGVEAGRTLPEGAMAAGWVPDGDLPALVADARALVLPSFAEGFGLPVIEAQAAGTPVACSDIPALREAAGDAAVFFDPHDAASIADALNMLLGDEEKRGFLRKVGRERAAQFTWTHVAEQTAAVYEAILSSPLFPSPSSPFKEKTASEKPEQPS